MDEYIERYGAERLWVATVVLLVGGIALAAALFPQRVYVDFIWQYYWGPVVADANGWARVDWAGGEQLNANEAGDAATGPTATPGYTFVSYAGYIPILILMATGLVLLLRRLDFDFGRRAFYALFPFFLFGGALRVVEDANVAASRPEHLGELVIGLPWVALLISPFIYFTVTAIAVIALVCSLWLERNGYVSGYEYPLGAIGTLCLVVTLAGLGYAAAFESYATFYGLLLVTTLVGATVLTAITWVVVERVAPYVNNGTGYMGLVVIWAHAVDGVANLIGLDYAVAFGHARNLVPKHPINEAIVNTFGTAWPFLFLKLLVPVLVIWLFNEEFFEESPRYAYLFMIIIVAVGLGPGTRDMLRATFGV